MSINTRTSTAPDMNIKLPDVSLKYSFIVSRLALRNSSTPTIVQHMDTTLNSLVLTTSHVKGEPPAGTAEHKTFKRSDEARWLLCR